jgi:hemolysin III
MDHAAIFVLTAGGYTPLFALVASPTGANNDLALYAIWAAGCFGVVKSIAWPSAPKWLTALVSVIIGWTGIGPTVARLPVVGSMCIALIFASGVTFSLGALVYALKRPNPWPKVFGYHEIFHLFVIAASALLFAHVALVVRAAGA